MNTRQLLPDFINTIKRPPGIGEFEALLDLYQHASFIIDIKSNRIILANSKATELTAYTRQELQAVNIKDLIPKWNPGKVSAGQTSLNAPDVTLIQRSGLPIHVSANSAPLTYKSNWTLVTLQRIGATQEKEVVKELGKIRLEALHILATAPQQLNLENALRTILQAGQLLTGGSSLAIYLQDSAKPNLAKFVSWGNEAFLPEKISSSEISLLWAPFIWKPGMRLISEMHQSALSQHANYMATIPLVASDPLKGILAIGDQITTPPPDLIDILAIIAGTISTYLYNRDIRQDLLDQIDYQNKNFDVGSAIKDSINEGYIAISKNLEIKEINSTAELTLGYKNDEVVGRLLGDILVGSENLSAIINTIPDLEPGIKNLGEYDLHRRDGKSILAHLKVIPIRENDKLDTIAILITDMTKEQEYRIQTKQLEQQALLGEFSAVFAHDVRNPINNISTGLQLMAFNNPDDQDLQKKIKRLLADCNRLDDLMNSVLSFSANREYKMEALDIGRTISNLVELSRPRMKKDNIIFRLQTDENIPPVQGDRRALEQVFTNLIANANRAMKTTGGTLAVNISFPAISNKRGMVHIDISDTGVGIPDQIKEKIFEPFFTTHREGAGLGLSITKRIVSAHNGQISVKSFPGGTVFKLILPMA